jgi:hypothetical protein
LSHGLFVFPTHDEEWAHNKIKLLEANEHFPVAKIDAVCHGLRSKSSSDDEMERLLKTLYICVGCKVMLTCNLNVKFCLFNGSSRTVMDIIYPSGKFP